ncbi:MAG: FCD domain-containing protein [Caulobacteraceae bacterium]
MAAQAAGRLCAADLEALDHSIELCRAPLTSAEDARRAAAEELAFHDRIAAVVDNPLLSFQCRALNEMLRRFVAIDLDPLELEAMRVANIEAHRRIAAAFASADAEAARLAMDRHIAEVAGHASRLGLAYRRSLVLEADFDVDVRLANQGLT